MRSMGKGAAAKGPGPLPRSGEEAGMRYTVLEAPYRWAACMHAVQQGGMHAL